MTWVKATNSQGRAIYLNMDLARSIVAGENDGAIIRFEEGSAHTVVETAEALLTAAGVKATEVRH